MPSGDSDFVPLTRQELSALWDEHTAYEFATKDVKVRLNLLPRPIPEPWLTYLETKSCSVV
jgi:hypothetical protein